MLEILTKPSVFPAFLKFLLRKVKRWHRGPPMTKEGGPAGDAALCGMLHPSSAGPLARRPTLQLHRWDGAARRYLLFLQEKP